MKLSFPNFRKAKILVVGDLMLDSYWFGSVNRISPEAPVPVVKQKSIEDKPGAAANVAMNLAALGVDVTLVGITGLDKDADILKNELSSVGINSNFIVDDTNPTIKKLRILSQNQQLIRIDFEEKFSYKCIKKVPQLISNIISDFDVLILSDYAKSTLDDCENIINEARKLNIPVIVDPKGNDFSKYTYASILTPNIHEFEQIVGPVNDDQVLIQKSLELIQKLSLEALLVTRGANGMTLVLKNGTEYHIPSNAKEVYDVTGAGDTVISVLSASIAVGSSFYESSLLANLAAGIVVSKIGTSTVNNIELAEKAQSEEFKNKKILTLEELVDIVTVHKQNNTSIVLTNGCFDLLHAGHVSYLNEAGQLGDKLIVAVNSDNSVRRLKGAGRPINTCDRRMQVLGGLGSVDYVVQFDEDTPQRLIAQILPDLLVKGGDYKINEIAGAEDVIENGGEVRILSFKDGLSTTNIINIINNETN
ncbi:bifunctional heptose 7-phosphate kinase/heptose 1-phosphate adenyltransferase [Paraphotobacterium marinum]|uniref:Bifunctional protein HldE n=1 Tax=Paraphotobacterium marinum TaxID=1755811 RepID=A0A220VDS2_9GAMM|nr:bifunctional D-glycero-beta-D-manno-heptose-7-phosphate kinase/D-glycero-beta-D-manno-heptose 1-phosphate adenylyltransferase HldE [Paraphotobacterium marinum]ASK78312.1 bifunctional heptose 7-phosphate kinase/heptose 1-phosphate adenyltransferase [Paraphotobacterium marinum]